jgi:hypothetical protein
MELHEKDNHILTLTVSYNEIENELMRCKQRHLQEEQHCADLTEQVEGSTKVTVKVMQMVVAISVLFIYLQTIW